MTYEIFADHLDYDWRSLKAFVIRKLWLGVILLMISKTTLPSDGSVLGVT